MNKKTFAPKRLITNYPITNYLSLPALNLHLTNARGH